MTRPWLRSALFGLSLALLLAGGQGFAAPMPPTRWIDVHVHLNVDACYGGLCGVDLLVKGMDEAGIDKAFLFALPDQTTSEQVLSAWRRYPDRIVPLRGRDGLDINDPSTLELYRNDLATGLFYGVGEIRTRHGWNNVHDPADHPVMIALWQMAAEFGVPVLIHMGTRAPGEDQFDIPAQWLAEFENALDLCPSTTFVWAHSGPAHADLVRDMLQRHPNLYADLSARNPVFLELKPRPPLPGIEIDGPEWIQLLEDHYDRFLFGTDAYWTEAYTGLPQLLAYVRDEVFSQLSDEAVEAIAHGNAERLFGIPAAEPEFVPEPGTIALLGSGLMGLAGYATLRWRTRE